MGGSGKGKGSSKGVRPGGNFAKRNATSTRLSRKIGWLNNNGKLLEEIRFSEVKEILAKTGDDEAMNILQHLEKKANEIQHPTNYIIQSARNSLNGGRRRGKGGGKRGGPGGGSTERTARPDDEEVQDEDVPPDMLDEDDEGPSGAPIELREAEPVEEPSDMEEDDVDNFADDMDEDPALSTEAVASKVEDALRYLNSQGNLNKELEVESLVAPLAVMGTEKAMEILNHLEEKVSEVRDPTAYILAATRKGSGKNARNARRQPPGKQVKKLHLKENSASSSSLDQALVEKVKKRIAWLNDRGGLNDKLNYDKVGELLLRSGPIGEVMKIFKTLEENASEVKNPNGYIAAAAHRLADEGVAPEPRSSAQRAQAQAKDAGTRDFRDEPLHEQLKAHIQWLNKEVPLNAPLDFAQVAKFLLELDTAEAGGILRRLEDSAKEVRDPNTYVIRAAQRILEGKGGGKGGNKRQPPPPPRTLQVPEPPPARSGNANPMDKIAKRVAWLNQHAQLVAPLDYDRVAPNLNSIGYYQSLEVLNSLEERAGTVRDPTGYVIANARRLNPEGGHRPSATPALPAPPVPPPPPKGHSKGEDKVNRRLEWLNKNVCSGKPIDVQRAGPVLMELDTGKAMEVLKNFEENAETVRDPTGYVIGTARRASKGETIGTAPRDSLQPAQERKVPPPAPPRPRPSAKGAGRPEPIGSFSRAVREPPAAPARGGGPEGRIRTRINWLNDKAGLQAPMDPDRAVSVLLRVQNDKDAMEILKRVEESASTIRDPTAYVVSAVRRTVDSGKGGRSGP